jgi:hypothetical protein
MPSLFTDDCTGGAVERVRSPGQMEQVGIAGPKIFHVKKPVACELSVYPLHISGKMLFPKLSDSGELYK